jgi:hypothetical protein
VVPQSRRAAVVPGQESALGVPTSSVVHGRTCATLYSPGRREATSIGAFVALHRTNMFVHRTFGLFSYSAG